MYVRVRMDYMCDLERVGGGRKETIGRMRNRMEFVRVLEWRNETRGIECV